jgi:hypothetical protein
MKRDEPKAITTIHGVTGLRFLLLNKSNSTDDRQISSFHMLCVTKTEGGG